LGEVPPFTAASLAAVLEELCGPGRFMTELDAVRCTLTLRVPPGAPAGAVADILQRRLPANIAARIDLLYATHRQVGRRRHAELSALTHKGIEEAE
jgi:hypothetical protein